MKKAPLHLISTRKEQPVIRGSTKYGYIAAFLLGGILISIVVVGCAQDISGAPTLHSQQPTPRPISTEKSLPKDATPTSTIIPSLVATIRPSATSTSAPPDWRSAGIGISRAYLPVPIPDTNAIAYLYALRINPQNVTLRVHYGQGEAHTVEEWQVITGAPILFNGGFFNGDNSPQGRIVSDGVLFGSLLGYDDDSIGVPGLFAITDHEAEMFALGHASYSPRGMRFDQAVESYPMLILPGSQPTFPKDTGNYARRTVIGIDQEGEIIIIVSDSALFTLFGLADWLSKSNLNLEAALNLDGGRSTGMGVQLPGETQLIPSYVMLPVIIAIYPR